jgi:hypothetical protein
MNTTEIIELAKRGAISHDQVYSELQRFAEEQRQHNQSADQAFSHYITKTAEGQKLFAAYKSMPNSQFDMLSPDRMSPAERGVPVAKVDDTEWTQLVKLYAKSYNLSEARAVDQLMACPKGMALLKKQLRAERMRNPDFSGLDHQQEAIYDQQRDEQRELHKRTTTQSRYEEMVAEVRRAQPSISELRAGDIVRATKDGQAAWLEFLRLGVGDPTTGAISGKPSPARISQVDSDMSGSRQSAGRDVKPAAPADDTVRYKSAEAQTALANFEFFTKVLFDASRRAGKNWSAEQCVSMLMKCPSARVYMDAACGA